MTVLITRPEHDVTTRYLSRWGEAIINFGRNKGFDVIDLNRDKANKRELMGRINKLDPKLVLLNGHGDEDKVTGHNNEVLIKAEENENILHDRITYALSCHSAKILGEAVVRDGHATYIGYVDEFTFVIDSKYISRPLDDKRAMPFMYASNQIAISLLKGHKAIDASTRSKGIFKNNYLKLLASNTDPDSLQVAQCLWWNMKNQVCLGKEDAKI